MLYNLILILMLGSLCLSFRFGRQKINWCKNLQYRFPPGDVVALASYPGSGNTWLRYLLQQATGIYTGSIYMDHGLRLTGFPAESVTDGSVLVVKTHANISDMFTSAILLIRNPKDAILSEFNRKLAGHIRQAPEWAFGNSLRGHDVMSTKKKNRLYWPKYVYSELQKWESWHSLWLQRFPGPLHIVFYEVLVRDTRQTLQGILNFLKHNYTEMDLYCAIANREGTYRRKKYYDFDPYTSDMYVKLNIAKNKVYKLAEDYQYTNNNRENRNI